MHILLNNEPIKPFSVAESLSSACVGYGKLEVLDALNMLLASLVVEICENDERSNLMRRLDKLLRERVKEIGSREKPKILLS